jgi:hypothetical protein
MALEERAVAANRVHACVSNVETASNSKQRPPTACSPDDAIDAI